MRNSSRGAADLALDLRHATEQEDHHPIDGLAEGEADRRVAQFVASTLRASSTAKANATR